MEIKNKKNIVKRKITIALIISVVFGSHIFLSYADSCPTCDGLTGEDKDVCEKKRKECKKLEEKTATYEKIVKLKQKQKSLLGSQINNLNNDISNVKKNIKDSKKKLEELDRKIENLQDKIEQKEKMIGLHRKMLGKMLQVYYETKRDIGRDVLLGLNTFYKLTSSYDHFGQLGKKIIDTTADLKAMQLNLQNEQEDLQKAKDEVVNYRIKLEEENNKLNSIKLQKNTLLLQTQGDEERYKRRLAKIEKQKREILGDIDALFNANYTELNSMVEKAPSKYWASTRWYYSQKDSRWGNKNIGNSKSKMKDYGCAISTVSMVFTYHGKQINPGSLRKKPIFYWDIIKWPTSSEQIGLGSGVNRIGSINHGNVSWKSIDKEIKEGNPVIIFINAKSGAGHYVVIHHKTNNGKYVVHDPYFGANIYLNSTFKLLSKIYKRTVSKKSVDQMIVYK